MSIKKYLLSDYKKGIDTAKYNRAEVKKSIASLADRFYISIMLFVYPNRVDVFNNVSAGELDRIKKLDAVQRYKLRVKALNMLEDILNDK
jgi:hypothetical protein